MRFTTSRFRNTRSRVSQSYRNRLKYDERRIVPSAPNYNGTMTRRKQPTSMIPYLPMPARPRIPQTYRIRRGSLTIRNTASGGSTFSSFTHGKKRMSKPLYNLFKNNQDWNISSLTSTRIDNNNYGRQSVSEFPTLTSVNFQDDLARPIGSVPTVARLSTSSLYYGTVEMITTFTNQELTTCYLSIYDIKPRFNISNALESPLYLWDIGLQYQGDDTGTRDTHLDVYEKPFRSEMFTNYYNVLNVQRVELSPGSTHKHTVRYHLNAKMLGYKFVSFDYVRNYTNWQMYVASGTPVNDATTLTSVSTSTIALDVVRKVTYNYTISNQARTQSISTTALGAIASANIITDTTIKPDSEA